MRSGTILIISDEDLFAYVHQVPGHICQSPACTPLKFCEPWRLREKGCTTGPQEERMLRRCGGAGDKDSRTVDQLCLSRRSGTSTYFLQEHHLERWRR